MKTARSRTVLNIVLAAAVVALTAVAWFEPGKRPPADAPPLTALAPESVSTIRVEPRGAEPFTLTRTPEGWNLDPPHSLPANDLRVTALLGILAARVHGGFRALGNDLARFGLAPPRATLRLDDLELSFGDTDPLKDYRYVLFDGEVNLITDSHLHHLTAGFQAFAHAAPLGRGAAPVELHLPGIHLALETGTWRPASEGARLPSADAANALADAWRHASAAAVKRLDPELPWGASLQVRNRGSSLPVHFEVARTEFEVILARPDLGLQYHFARRTGERLLSLAPHLETLGGTTE